MLGGADPGTSSIDNTALAASYDQIHTLRHEWSNGSNFAVSRSVRTHVCRGIGSLCWRSPRVCWREPRCSSSRLPCAGSARSVQSRLSWDRDRALDLNVQPTVVAPPVLTHPPCQGETPDLPIPSIVSGGPALLERGSASTLQVVCDRLAAHSPAEHRQPPAVRLDRPPRPIEFGVIIVLPA